MRAATSVYGVKKSTSKGKLMVVASTFQSNTRPLAKLRSSDATETMLFAKTKAVVEPENTLKRKSKPGMLKKSASWETELNSQSCLAKNLDMAVGVFNQSACVQDI